MTAEVVNLEREVEVGVPAGLLPDPEARTDLGRALTETVLAVWEDLGLPSRPQVTVSAGPAGSVSVDGHRIPVSARRVELAALAGSGTARGSADGYRTPAELLDSRLDGVATDPVAVAGILGCVVDACLRTNLAHLVGAGDDAEVVSRGLLTKSGRTDISIGLLGRAVAFAAELGVAPRQLDGAAGALAEVPVTSESMTDPVMLAGRLAAAAVAAAPQALMIELERGTLRRLTTGNGGFLACLGAEGVGLGQAIREAVFSDYGVCLPAVSLRVAELPSSVVRFRIGGLRTQTHLVLPDSQAVLPVHPSELPTSTDVRPFVDPVRGGVWSLVERPVDPSVESIPAGDVFGPVILIGRALLAEVKTRLALWPPTCADLFALASPQPGTEHLPLAAADVALRWLLAAQVSTQPVARLLEAVVTAAAKGGTTATELIGWMRTMLGGSVLGPIPIAARGRRIVIDAGVAEAAASANTPDPLFEVHPELIDATYQMVISCPGVWRRDVERLLRPLADTVVVVTGEDLTGLPFVIRPPRGAGSQSVA